MAKDVSTFLRWASGRLLKKSAMLVFAFRVWLVFLFGRQSVGANPFSKALGRENTVWLIISTYLIPSC